MIVLTAMVVAAIVVLAGRARRPAGRRLRTLGRDESPEQVPEVGQSVSTISASRLALAAVVATGLVVTVGGLGGVLLGGVAVGAIALIRPRASPDAVNADEVPVVVDLVAGCLAAGAALPDALSAAAVAAGPGLRAACESVAASLRSGVPAEDAWRFWLADPCLAPVARTAVRTTQSGAAAADDLRRTSTRLRAQRRARAQHRVRQASVWLVVPLGLCFLPAFILLAVVPLVVGLLPSLR